MVVVQLKGRCADPRGKTGRPDPITGTTPVSGQNKAVTLPQSDGIIRLRLQPKDTDVFSCSGESIVTNGSYHHPSLVLRCSA